MLFRKSFRWIAEGACKEGNGLETHKETEEEEEEEVRNTRNDAEQFLNSLLKPAKWKRGELLSWFVNTQWILWWIYRQMFLRDLFSIAKS